MNFLEIREYTLSLLDDLQATYFTPVQVNRWINNGLIELQKLLILAGQNYYMECVTTPLVYGQTDYVLPDDFEHLHRLEIILGGIAPSENVSPLSQITLNQQDLVPNQVGTPVCYYYKQDRLTILPAPSNTWLLRLYYSYQIAGLVNDTDIPNAPAEYHEFIGLLAAIDGYLKDNRDATPLIAKRAYYEKMMKDASNERSFDSPRSIVNTNNNYEVDYYW